MMGKAAQTPDCSRSIRCSRRRRRSCSSTSTAPRRSCSVSTSPTCSPRLQVYVGSALCQRLQSVRTDLPRPGAGRCVAPAGAEGRAGAARAQYLRRDVPLGSFTTVRDISGPSRAAALQSLPGGRTRRRAAPGYSQGDAIQTMQRLAAETLPDGFSYEWTSLAFQQIRAGNTAIFAFVLGVAFVFLVLAAQYESLTLPLAVILIVPMCLVAAIIGVVLRGMDNNILTQVGFIVLIAPRRQERDSDRRIRQTARGPGPRPAGGGGRGGALEVAADPDDVARLRVRRGAAWSGRSAPAPSCGSPLAPRYFPA